MLHRVLLDYSTADASVHELSCQCSQNLSLQASLQKIPLPHKIIKQSSELENLKPWYELGDTIPGSMSCHHFVPTFQYTIEGKQLSIDTTIFITLSFQDMPAPQNETPKSLKCNDYITCCFDGFWSVTLIEVVNKEEKDLP